MKFLLLAGLALAFGGPTIAAGVADVAGVQLAGLTVTRIEHLPGGDYQPPGAKQAFSGLPPFCLVTAILKPAPDSQIRIELWLPQGEWNGKFLGTGNGGGAGHINHQALAAGLKRGYATVNTDMGTAPSAELVIRYPDRWVDFGYRATHEMTTAAKALVQAYYGKAPRHAYFVGASTGGQQALMEAQRYPEDYDGLIAGAPANNRTHLHAMFVWNWQAVHQTPASFLPRDKVELVRKAVLAAGVGQDGGAPDDDFLTDPRLGKFDPETLLAPADKEADGTHLSPAQVVALKRIYAGPSNPRTGESIYTPPPYGSETLMYLTDDKPDSSPAYSFVFRWALGAHRDFRTFDFDRDLAHADRRLAALLNANSPDLSGLQRLGGKFLMYSGTADAITPFQDAAHYYERVIQAQGGLGRTQEFFRYFVVPGMGHVSGGPGPNDFGQLLGTYLPRDGEHDILLALEEWVEQGKAPDKIIATAFKNGDPTKEILLQRPLYPYPKFPHYLAGDRRLPANYHGVDHAWQGVTPATTYLTEVDSATGSPSDQHRSPPSVSPPPSTP